MEKQEVNHGSVNDLAVGGHVIYVDWVWEHRTEDLLKLGL